MCNFSRGNAFIDAFQKTSIDGIYACGDNTSVSAAVANRSLAGATIVKELTEELF